MKIRCKECHTEINDADIFCSGCGRRLGPLQTRPAAPRMKTACPKCGAEVDDTASVCPECGSSLRWSPTAPQVKKQTAHPASKTLVAILLLLIIVVPSLLWLSSVTRLSQQSTFTIQVSSDTSWSGSYGSVAGTASVDGQGSHTFQVTGTIVSAVFQKRTAGGFLSVAILLNGSVVASQSTTAAYGVVSVSAHS